MAFRYQLPSEPHNQSVAVFKFSVKQMPKHCRNLSELVVNGRAVEKVDGGGCCDCCFGTGCVCGAADCGRFPFGAGGIGRVACGASGIGRFCGDGLDSINCDFGFVNLVFESIWNADDVDAFCDEDNIDSRSTDDKDEEALLPFIRGSCIGSDAVDRASWSVCGFGCDSDDVIVASLNNGRAMLNCGSLDD